MNKKSNISSMFFNSYQDEFIKISLASELMKIFESPSNMTKSSFVRPINVASSSVQDLYRRGFINFTKGDEITLTSSGKKLLESFILNNDDCTIKDKPRYLNSSNIIRRI